jgi:cytochrome c biogenesis protein CcmG/thiol:disulfide interchange protein DsbE
MKARTPADHRGRAPRLVRQLILGAIVAGFLALLAYGLLSKGPDDAIDASLARLHPAKAPGFDLPILASGDLTPPLAARLAPAMADGRLTLPELRGTPVVLNFWASWCVPCRQEAPILESGWQRYASQRVLVLGLNMQDLTTDANRFIASFHNTYPNIRDQGSGTANDWGVTGVPETFFISPRSQVVGHVIGVVSASQLDQGIAASESGRAVGTLTGGDSRPTK